MLADVPVHLVTERAAKALSDTVTPVGLVAVCSTCPTTSLADVLADSPRLVAVAVEISEPGNAGTLIRIADAMGADAVVLAGHSVDPYNGKCLRASAGSIFAMPVVSDADAGGRGCGAPRVRACRCWRPPSTARSASTTPTCPPPTAWLFGPEAHGLSAELAALADAPGADSDVGQRREPQRGGRRRDLPVPERKRTAPASAECEYMGASSSCFGDSATIAPTGRGDASLTA